MRGGGGNAVQNRTNYRGIADSRIAELRGDDDKASIALNRVKRICAYQAVISRVRRGEEEGKNIKGLKESKYAE